jgi:hypothetical protein
MTSITEQVPPKIEKALIIYGYIAPIAAVPKRIINVTRPC